MTFYFPTLGIFLQSLQSQSIVHFPLPDPCSSTALLQLASIIFLLRWLLTLSPLAIFRSAFRNLHFAGNQFSLPPRLFFFFPLNNLSIFFIKLVLGLHLIIPPLLAILWNHALIYKIHTVQWQLLLSNFIFTTVIYVLPPSDFSGTLTANSLEPSPLHQAGQLLMCLQLIHLIPNPFIPVTFSLLVAIPSHPYQRHTYLATLRTCYHPKVI